jgi:hypothetical protein
MKARVFVATAAVSLLGALSVPLIAGAAPSSPPAFGLQPFTFVGAAGDCGVGSPAGNPSEVTAKWVGDTGNPAPSILLQKNGPTSDCVAAGVDIVSSLEGGPVASLTELNFDYKTGEHCGGGAPRFNVVVDNNTYFLGCNGGVQTDAGNGYTHVVFTPVQFAAAGIPTTGTLNDVYIIFDEGTDTPVGGTVGTPGTVHIDNISVNNDVVGSATSPVTANDCKNGGYKNFVSPTFTNQGQCERFVQTGKPPANTKKPGHQA